MTASSLQFLSTRVQLIGIPKTTTDTIPTTPPHYAKTRVSRNLFGSPQQGEIKQKLENELEHNLQRFRQRYSFDIISNNNSESELDSSPTTATATTTTVNNRIVADINSENLISKELAQYELRLSSINTSAHGENNRLCSAGLLPSATTPTNNKKRIASSSNVEIIKSNGLNSVGSDRLKRKARQSLLTACYNIRKVSQCNNKTRDICLYRTSTMRQKIENSISISQPKLTTTKPEENESTEEGLSANNSNNASNSVATTNTATTIITASNNIAVPMPTLELSSHRQQQQQHDSVDTAVIVAAAAATTPIERNNEV